MNNYMKEVSDILGVKIDETFVISRKNPDAWTFAKLTNNGLQVEEQKIDLFFWKPSLTCLLRGDYTIEKLKWKPEFHEKYYSIGICGTLEVGCWMNDFLDMTLYRIGNCYKTMEEASTHINKWIDFYNSTNIIEL